MSGKNANLMGTIAMADGRPVKHSLTLNGHRTSVSLEAPFWNAFRHIARAKKLALNELATEIDTSRGTGTGLASAIRLYVLHYHAGNKH